MKVFIADDEIFVIELLLHLIDWESLDLEVVGTAKDGITALEEIKKTSPDIVITDIRMPGMNGLEMIQAIQNQNPSTAFVIISGHSNFEYAQSAIRFGVKDYILKPINANDLMEILTNLTSDIKSRMRHTSEFKEMNQKFDVAKVKLHDAFLTKISENSLIPINDVDTLNHDYLLKFRPGNFQFLLLKFDCKTFHEDSFLPTQLHERVLSNITHYFEDACFETVVSARPFKYLVLINYDPSHTLQIQQNFQFFLDDIELLCKKYSNLYFTICKGSVETDPKNIRHSYENAVRALRVRVLRRLDTVIDTPPPYNPTPHLNQIFPQDAKENLKRNIEKFDVNEIRSQITQLFAFAEGTDYNSAELFWELCTQIYVLFLDIIQNLELFADYTAEMDDFLLSLDRCIDIVGMRTTLIDRIVGHINYYTSLEESTDNTYITIAKKYISDHYMEKITLDDIAQLVFLNPVYFSILFKQEVGINFVDYLNKYRIEISKQYLKDISQSLCGIADLVGFTNVKYFSKIFKRIVGITPSQYRNKYIRHNQS